MPDNCYLEACLLVGMHYLAKNPPFYFFKYISAFREAVQNFTSFSCLPRSGVSHTKFTINLVTLTCPATFDGCVKAQFGRVQLASNLQFGWMYKHLFPNWHAGNDLNNTTVQYLENIFVVDLLSTYILLNNELLWKGQILQTKLVVFREAIF